MKILAIDDQQLVLLPLEKRLTKLGYEVKTLVSPLNVVETYETFLPDLVIVDIDMPTISGIKIIQYIRQQKGDQIPIMVLSGNTDENIILQTYELGIQDYMKKPLTLDEISARVKNILGKKTANIEKSITPTIIQKKCIGVVIPVQNIDETSFTKEFTDFIDTYTGYHICFVNHASTNNTLDILNKLRKGREDHVIIYNCETPKGKGEAIRLGMLYMAELEDLDYIGYIDIEQGITIKNFDRVYRTIEDNNYEVVTATSTSSLTASNKHIKRFVNKIVDMPFQDALSGLKILKREVVKYGFQEKFKTKKWFAIELLIRLKKHYNESASLNMYELPVDNKQTKSYTKLSVKDYFKIILQLATLARTYKGEKPQKKTTLKLT
ncbi:transcriptional regulator [Neptunitalea chrysea]|uniref:Transcriptional regulator n=1 Tax=Neptunitalea chrysea TaxID=1647581 RepID=A0A9W6B373_9FLAO|nr:response regulator [Neptunitalea chrysea]GLB51678.1 transcriptional regulator [Neptunitalea chrysea]